MENIPGTWEELEDLLCIAHTRALRIVPCNDVECAFAMHVHAVTLAELQGHITGKELFSSDELMKAKIAGMLAKIAFPAEEERR